MALLLMLCLVGVASAQTQNIPPKPDQYITDNAGVLDAGTVAAVNAQLDNFERATSNQILVAIYPNLPQDAELYQYCTDVASAWAPGQKGKDNGAVLFVFINDHKMYIATGRGLEGALPDAICKNIITYQIGPSFKQGDYAGGIQAGVNAMLAATKGEYKGTGSTDDDQKEVPAWVVVLIILLIIGLQIYFACQRGSGPVIFTSGGWGGGGYGGGGGGFGGGGGGGGFSSGGGSFGGGGAGGGW